MTMFRSLSIFILATSFAHLSLLAVEPDLVTVPMTDQEPKAGRRVRQVAVEYSNSNVYHSLYLPTNWQRGRTYPVIVEYTGNRFPPGGGSGEVKDANLGFGLSGGKDYIWVVMPYIANGRQENAVQWWGDRRATVEYCKRNLPKICEQFGGDPERVLLSGFSRGAIATSYIGLADPEIAQLWTAFFTHDHFDGQKRWGYPEDDRESALQRLARLKGRPVFVCGLQGTKVKEDFLGKHLHLAKFDFLDVPVAQIFRIPENEVLHPHTDRWMHRESRYRDEVRSWLRENVWDAK